MNFLEGEFLNYEQSLKMKILGFKDPCFGCYNNDKNLLIYYIFDTNVIDERMVLAPQFKQSFEWFKKKYGLITYFTFEHNGWVYTVVGNNFKMVSRTHVDYKSAEDECLKKLFKITQKGKKQ